MPKEEEALAVKMVLTGATGFIGSHVLTELQDHGHEVTALVRDDTQADIVKARGATPAVADLTEAAAVAVGAPGAVPGSGDEARARLGDSFAEVLLLDQGTVAAKARAELGWSPSHPSLVDEFRHESYHK
jgi:uncharacterized protein YbjT (DUF2867 family)